MTETVKNTLDLARSFDIDFVGSPIVGEDEITTTFVAVETLEILTANSLANNINIRYNTL